MVQCDQSLYRLWGHVHPLNKHQLFDPYQLAMLIPAQNTEQAPSLLCFVPSVNGYGFRESDSSK